MALTRKQLTDIAVPLTGWVVTDDEALEAYRRLMALSDPDLAKALRQLANHAHEYERARNRVKILLDNLSEAESDRVLRRMLDGATARTLGSIAQQEAVPYERYVVDLHKRLGEMGMGKRRALGLAHNMIAKGEFGSSYRVAYTARFGSDNTRGWDKCMHFVASAYLTYYVGAPAALAAGYGKEAWDAAEHLVGKDPVGWSDDDIVADKRGVEWGKQLLSTP